LRIGFTNGSEESFNRLQSYLKKDNLFNMFFLKYSCSWNGKFVCILAIFVLKTKLITMRTKYLLLLLCIQTLLLAQPATFQSVGIGGGGALYSPSFNPANPTEIFMGCDMTELYQTQNQGETWAERPFTQIQGGVWSEMQFTNNPNIRYCVSHAAVNYVDNIRPMKSIDGGIHWTEMTTSPALYYNGIHSIYADYDHPNRLIINDVNKIFLSNDGGATFTLLYTFAGSGGHVAGVFFDDTNIYIGREDGIFYSTDNGLTFNLLATTGFLTAGEKIKSFAAAKTGTALKFECLTAIRTWAGVLRGSTYWGDMQGIYTMSDNNGTWTPHLSGINAYDFVNWLGMARNDTSMVYSAGGNGSLFPIVMKSVHHGAWQHCFFTANNANIATGWSGYQRDRTWDYGSAPQGFQVCPSDASKVIFTDLGFVHLTTDGGANWKQAYVKTASQNATGAPSTKFKNYEGNGLQNSGCWDLLWLDNNTILAGFSDITGLISRDGGTSWKFLPLYDNSIYKALKHSDNKVYIATSNTHDMYQSTKIYDASIDAGLGAIQVSSDDAGSFSVLKNFGHPVVWIATDPTNAHRMYASVLHSDTNIGGIWVTDDLQNGTLATWTKLAAPTGANGHPFNIRVLNDGNLVVSFSARVPTVNSQFTATSGVFYYETATQTWYDRSHANMKYWTKDVVIDPNDPTQNTWYACVFQGWGSISVQGTGGLFKTTDRGLNWTKINNEFRVNSVSIVPNHSEILYFSTETVGLWYSSNATSATPTFSQITNYPFRHPMRIFFHPNNVNQVWTTSFGGGMKFGNLATPLPLQLLDFKGIVAQRTAFLEWHFAQGTHINRFEIQKSWDGKDFEKIGTIAFAQVNNHGFEDKYFDKSAYYRLKIVENDEKFQYSKVLFLEQPMEHRLKIFPNPTTGILWLDVEYWNQPFVVYNSIGQIILRGDLSEQLDLQGFMNGIYWLKVGGKWARFVKE
jgi:photosystem II stability/assembly factor-like uncharacterized protein